MTIKEIFFKLDSIAPVLDREDDGSLVLRTASEMAHIIMKKYGNSMIYEQFQCQLLEGLHRYIQIFGLQNAKSVIRMFDQEIQDAVFDAGKESAIFEYGRIAIAEAQKEMYGY